MPFPLCVHPLAHVQSLIPTHKNHGKNGIHHVMPRIHNTLVDDTTRVNLPRIDRVKCERVLKRLPQPCGVERHLYINTTDEDRVVCIYVHPCEVLARGQRGRDRRLESSIWDARADNEALVSIPVPDSKDSTMLTGPFSKFAHTVLEESTQKFPVSWAALAHTRVDVPMRQSTAPLSLHLR